MSYHDGYIQDYKKNGIAVVNPLIRIEKKLTRVREVLDSIDDKTTLTANDLKTQLQLILNDG